MKLKRKRSRLRLFFFFYPGGIWARRVGNLIILFTIGFNMYIEVIQTQMFEEGRCMIEEAEATISKYDSISEATISTIRDLDNYIGWSVNDFWGALAYYSISKENNEMVQQVEEHRTIVTEYTNQLKQYGSVYAAISTLLKIITWLFWIRVAISLIWIIGDLIYGNARRLMTFFLLLAAGFDVWIYLHLTEHYPLYVLPDTLFNGFFSIMDFLEGTLSTISI